MSDRLSGYQELVRSYHLALDLMSERGLETLPAKIEEAEEYVRALDALAPNTAPVLDLGSGAGLPGLVVALMSPRRRVFLVERRERRAAFLRIAVSQLGLGNAAVLAQDVRSVRLEGIAAVTAQAVGHFALVYCLTRRTHAPEVLLLARKGPAWRAEAGELAELVGAPVSPVWDSPLRARGRLVGLRATGGLACPSSA